MDLLTTLSACSLYHHDLALVVAMAMSFSHGNPFMVQDASADSEMAAFVTDAVASDELATLPMPQTPQTRQAALEAISRVTKKGGEPVMGILPVSAAWAAVFQRTPSQALNACTNVAIATAMLSEFERQCQPHASRTCILAKYTSGLGLQYFDTDVLHDLARGHQGNSKAVIDPTNAVLQAPVFSEAQRAEGEDPDGIRTLLSEVPGNDAADVPAAQPPPENHEARGALQTSDRGPAGEAASRNVSPARTAGAAGKVRPDRLEQTISRN